MYLFYDLKCLRSLGFAEAHFPMALDNILCHRVVFQNSTLNVISTAELLQRSVYGCLCCPLAVSVRVSVQCMGVCTLYSVYGCLWCPLANSVRVSVLCIVYGCLYFIQCTGVCALYNVWVSVLCTVYGCLYSVRMSVLCTVYGCLCCVQCTGVCAVYSVRVSVLCTVYGCLCSVQCTGVCALYSVRVSVQSAVCPRPELTDPNAWRNRSRDLRTSQTPLPLQTRYVVPDMSAPHLRILNPIWSKFYALLWRNITTTPTQVLIMRCSGGI